MKNWSDSQSPLPYLHPLKDVKKKMVYERNLGVNEKTKENRKESSKPKPKEKLLVIRKKPKKIFHKMNL